MSSQIMIFKFLQKHDLEAIQMFCSQYCGEESEVGPLTLSAVGREWENLSPVMVLSCEGMWVEQGPCEPSECHEVLLSEECWDRRC